VRRRRAPVLCLLACLVLVSASVGGQRPPSAPPQRARPPRDPGIAAPGILVLDLPSGRTLSAVQPDLLATRLSAGPILQAAALAAALESGIVSPDTAFTCRRRITVDGRQLLCNHPDAGGPMSPAQALAGSCNDFFASIGQRLPRETLTAMTSVLGLGGIPATTSMPLAAVGLDGLQANPEQLLRALVRVADVTAGVRLRRETRDVLLAGLRAAARQGSARAIGDRAIDALAVAWTTPAAGGGSQGVALAISPSAHWSRGVAVLLPGGSGSDAAGVAGETLAELIEGTYWQAPGGVAKWLEGSRITPSPPGGFGVASRTPEGSNVAPAPAKPQAGASPLPAIGGTAVRVGRLRLTGGYEVTAVPIEEYVARVLAGEAAARSAPAALEALAITVRTFAIANLGRHRNEGFDLCETTHCQVLAASSTAATRAAAAATAGRILTYRGQ
jgi:hypothetical protein